MKKTLYAQAKSNGAPLTGLTPSAFLFNVDDSGQKTLQVTEVGGGMYSVEYNPTQDGIVFVDFGATARHRYASIAWSVRGQLWAVVVTDENGELMTDAPSIGAYYWLDGTDRLAEAPPTMAVRTGLFAWRASLEDIENGASIRVDAPTGSSEESWFSNIEKQITASGRAIGSLIRDALLNDAQFVSLVGSRLYPNELPQNVNLPAVVYNVVSDVPENSFDGSASTRIKATRVQIDCYARATTEQGAYALAHLVGDRVENVVGDMSRFTDGADGVYESFRDLYDNVTQYHRVSMDFTLWK